MNPWLNTKALLDGSIDYGYEFRVALVPHYFRDVPSEVLVDCPLASERLTRVKFQDGKMTADDVVFASVAPGMRFGEFLIFQDQYPKHDRRIAVARSDVAFGFPMNTNGGDICIQWDRNAGLFNLNGEPATAQPLPPNGYNIDFGTEYFRDVVSRFDDNDDWYAPAAPPKECEECYGTGFFHGIGGPCPKGCKRA